MPQRRLSADYYPIVARAVASLPSNNERGRADIYERARQTLLKQLSAMEPPLSGAEIAAELWALDEAIARTMPAAPAPARPAPASQPAPPASAGGTARTTRIVITTIATLLAAGLAYFTYQSSVMRGSILFALQQGVTAFVIFTLPALYLVSVLRRRSRLRQAGLIKHRIRAFARNADNPQAQQEIAQKRDDHALQWAYFLPDHKPQAKAIIAAELERRGHTRRHIETWSPGAPELTVPPAVDGTMTGSRYGVLKRQKALWLGLFRGAVITLATLMASGIIIAIVAALVPSYGELTTESNRWLEDSTIPKAAFYTLLVFWISSPFLVGFLYRNRALRILLLRPFGETRMTRALKRFVPKTLGPEGYVFTLSDRNYKPSVLMAILVMIPLQGFDVLVTMILGPLLRNSTRVSSVRNERKFRKLEKILLRKFRASSWSFIGGGQAFNIRTTDAWWQMCIQMLMHSCDVIVVDLSKVKAGTEWELDELRQRALHHKCVFVTGEEHLADIGPVLEHHFADHDWPTVYVYRNSGTLTDPHAFDVRLGLITEAAIAGWGREAE